MEETLDHISPILPADFFQIAVDLYPIQQVKDLLKKKHQLPDFSELLFEHSFAEVACGWHRKGIVFDIHFEKPFEECFFPQVRRGDSVEIFIDTRDLKTAGFPTRFCHHFVILPQPIDEISGREVTTFRSDDRHDLCDPQLIQVKGDFRKRSYDLNIFLPSECLHGYDSTSFDRLGLAYRMNRVGGDPQHLSVSSDYWNLESQPSLWSSIQLRKK